MNVKKVTKDTETSQIVVRQLKTDDEVLVEATSSPDRVRATKALMRSRCTLLVPEMLNIIRSIAENTEEGSKVRLEAARYIVDRGLGTVDKETLPIVRKVEEAITNAELEEVLKDSVNDQSD